jgi:hypothetical protein
MTHEPVTIFLALLHYLRSFSAAFHLCVRVFHLRVLTQKQDMSYLRFGLRRVEEFSEELRRPNKSLSTTDML